MPTARAVTIPLINPNEPEALLASIYIHEGQCVAAGDRLCTLETTKATLELASEQAGYIIGLRYSSGQTVNAGDCLCYLSDEPGWSPEEPDRGVEISVESIPEGLRISQPALAMARSQGLDLRKLPRGPLITESTLQELLVPVRPQGYTPPTAAFDPTAILVYGGGGHGKTLIELLNRLGTYRVIGVVDDGLPAGQLVLGMPVLGGSEVLDEFYSKGVRLALNAVGGIGNLGIRINVFHKLAQSGYTCPAIAHPSAVIESSARLSPGVQIFTHAYIGSQAFIGYGAIINTGVIISHDCVLGDYVNISPAAVLAGGVQVGAGSLIGMGVTVNLQVKIGNGARIGNGATIKSDVPEGGVVHAGAVWPEK